MIEIKNLHKSYGKTKVLEDLNLTISSGQIVGVVGANGAGKSTLFNCIAGFQPYEGVIQSELNNLRTEMGFLETHPEFLTKLTGEEYLILHCNARRIPVPELNEKNIFELPLTKYCSEYSTGMKKKLALTAIILQNNQVFILDEPFNGVDIQSNMMIKDLILKLKSLQKTVIISSHIFSALGEICDVIHCLEKGSISRAVFPDQYKELEKSMLNRESNGKIDSLNLS